MRGLKKNGSFLRVIDQVSEQPQENRITPRIIDPNFRVTSTKMDYSSKEWTKFLSNSKKNGLFLVVMDQIPDRPQQKRTIPERYGPNFRVTSRKAHNSQPKIITPIKPKNVTIWYDKIKNSKF